MTRAIIISQKENYLDPAFFFTVPLTVFCAAFPFALSVAVELAFSCPPIATSADAADATASDADAEGPLDPPFAAAFAAAAMAAAEVGEGQKSGDAAAEASGRIASGWK